VRLPLATAELDAGSAAPAAALCCCSVGGDDRGDGLCCAAFVVDVGAKESGSQEQTGGDQGESLSSLPLIAYPAVRETSQVERIGLAVIESVVLADDQAEGNEPSHAEEEVERVVEEIGGEWQQEEERDQNREGTQGDGVDDATPWCAVVVAKAVEKVCCQSQDDGSANELREAQSDAECSSDNHIECSERCGVDCADVDLKRKS